MRSIAQRPNANLIVWLDSPRGATYGPHLFERAGRVQLVERLRSNTHRVIAIGLGQKGLGNTWWALNAPITPEQEKALLLWLNSSLSLLLFFGHRVTTQGAWMQMKQPAWQSMPVLDVRSLSGSQLSKLAATYDKVSGQELAPIAQLDADMVRGTVDSSLSEVLGLPDLAPIRALLAREPGLNAAEINPRRESESSGEEDEAEMSI